MARKAVQWDLEVQVVDHKTSQPLADYIVEAWDKDYANTKNRNDLLFIATTDRNGKYRHQFDKSRFQDVTRQHFDKKRPDVYFVIKDLRGNRLLETEVKTHLKGGFYPFVFRIQPSTNSQLSSAGLPRNEWRIFGQLTFINAGQRYVVQCYDKDIYNRYGEDDWLFTVTTDAKGKFEHTIYDSDFSFKVGKKRSSRTHILS